MQGQICQEEQTVTSPENREPSDQFSKYIYVLSIHTDFSSNTVTKQFIKNFFIYM